MTTSLPLSLSPSLSISPSRIRIGLPQEISVGQKGEPSRSHLSASVLTQCPWPLKVLTNFPSPASQALILRIYSGWMLGVRNRNRAGLGG